MSSDRSALLNAFIQQVVQGAGNVTLYSLDHPRVVSHLAKSMEWIEAALADAGEVSFIVVADELFHGGRPLPKGPLLARFVAALQARHIGHLVVRAGVTMAELQFLLLLVAGKAGDIRSLEHLHFGSVDVPALDTPEDGAFDSFVEMPHDLKEGLAATYEKCRGGERFDLHYVLRVVKGFTVALQRDANPFLALVPLREMDAYTFTHSINVCILNLAQGVSLGFHGALLRDIGVAGMLHDVGKLFVPPEILTKPGNLEPWEWEMIHQHPVKGAEYLLNTPGMPRLAVLSTFEHHLRYDKTGYPKVPSWWKVNFCSQITMVSDCFDALRSRRIYQSAHDFEKASGRMLEISGKSLNPALTFNFLKMLHDKGEGVEE